MITEPRKRNLECSYYFCYSDEKIGIFYKVRNIYNTQDRLLKYCYKHKWVALQDKYRYGIAISSMVFILRRPYGTSARSKRRKQVQIRVSGT